jgi:hypothetical protein
MNTTNTATDRSKLERAAWRGIHPDYRGKFEDGTLTCLQLIEGKGTCLVPVSTLPESKLIDLATNWRNGRKVTK